MQPERLEQIKPLIAAALAKPAGERDAFLRRICGDDVELRRDIDSFLRHKSDTDPTGHQAETIPNARISLETPSAQVTEQIPSDPRIGKQFGKYLIRQRLAEGGMGIVYLAIDTQLGREVALKVLPEYFSMDRDRLARFRREARATSLLNHPNIVTVFEIGQMDDCEFIVTEFVEGRTLRDLMRQGPIPFVEVLKIGSQVAGALATAHKAGVVHRDIKPENVMVRPDGYVKVLDFGLAKLTDSTRKTVSGDIKFSLSGINKTTPGMIMGTVSYMSPEQAEGQETDPRTDIWALGIMLYEMVAGKVPFKGPTSSHTIVAIIEREPEPIEHASPEMRHLISTALQKDRALRFQTAAAMAAAIDDVKHRLGYVSDQNIAGPANTTEQMVSVPASVSVAAPKPSPFRKLVWIVPGLVVLLLIGSAAVFAIAGWLLDLSRDQNVTIENTIPSPTATLAPSPVVPSPTPTAGVIYAEPTPEPTATAIPEITPQKPTPKPVVERPTPGTRRTPRPTPRPKTDPNCVFTNTC